MHQRHGRWVLVHVGGPLTLLIFIVWLAIMPLVAALGWIAATLTFLAFYATHMMTLRCLAIGANLSFIAYGWYGNLTPVLVLHGVLLPLNIFRLRQLKGKL